MASQSTTQLVARLRKIPNAYRYVFALSVLLVSLVALGFVFKIGSFVDEADYLVGACEISKGHSIYQAFFSHHLPIPYYVLSFFYKFIGCKLYIGRYLIAGTFVGVFLAYYWVSKNVYYLFALLGFILLSPFYFGYYFIAESLLAIGIIAALLPAFFPKKFPTTLFFLWFLVAAIIINSSNQIGILFTLLFMLYFAFAERRNIRILIVVIFLSYLPTALILLLNHSFRPFYDQAIRFNTEIYAHYLGSSLINPFAIAMSALQYLIDKVTFPFQLNRAPAWFYSNLGEIVLLIGVGYSLLKTNMHISLKILLGFLLLLSLNRVSQAQLDRGEIAFHLLPFLLISLLIVSYELGSLKSVRVSSIYTLALLLIGWQVYTQYVPANSHGHENDHYRYQDRLVRDLTSAQDSVLFYPLDPISYLTNQRKPGSFYYYFLPWLADIPDAQDKVIADIERNQVKFIYFDNTVIWGKYRTTEYAKKIYDHILATYMPVDATESAKARIFLRR